MKNALYSIIALLIIASLSGCIYRQPPPDFNKQQQTQTQKRGPSPWALQHAALGSFDRAVQNRDAHKAHEQFLSALEYAQQMNLKDFKLATGYNGDVPVHIKTRILKNTTGQIQRFNMMEGNYKATFSRTAEERALAKSLYDAFQKYKQWTVANIEAIGI